MTLNKRQYEEEAKEAEMNEGITNYVAEYETQGTLHDEVGLAFHPGPGRCGHITDAVTFWHPDDGAWVISFASLKDMYERACEARGIAVAAETSR